MRNTFLKNLLLISLFVLCFNFIALSQGDEGSWEGEIEKDTYQSPSELPTYTETEEEKILDTTNLKTLTEIETIQEDVTIITPYGEISGIGMQDVLFGSNGVILDGVFYSTIPGSELYFGSNFDDAKFKLEMSKNSEARIVQHNADGFWDKIKVDMSKDDILKQYYESEDEEVYTFSGTGENPLYTYYEDGSIIFEEGEMQFEDIDEETTETISGSAEETELTIDNKEANTGFKCVTLNPEQELNVEQYTVKNTNIDDYKVCINIEGTVADEGDGYFDFVKNKISLRKKSSLFYENSLIYESYDINNEIEFKITEEGITVKMSFWDKIRNFFKQFWNKVY